MIVRTPTLSALALLTFSTLGNAQVVREAPQIPPAAASESEHLPMPDAPIVPPALAARVDALTRIVERTSECYTNHEERAEHVADRRCPQWYATLIRGGPAAAHAIGRMLDVAPGDNRSEYSLRATAGEDQRVPRLMQILAANSASLAVPYLLRYLAMSVQQHGAPFGDSDYEALHQLGRLTGHDLTPSIPWEPTRYVGSAARIAAVHTWLRWWRDHQGETPAAWRAHGEQRALSDLTHDDPAVRFSAMQRLVGVAAYRGAVQASLNDVLRRDDLPARARVVMRRWAARVRLPLPSAVAVPSTAMHARRFK